MNQPAISLEKEGKLESWFISFLFPTTHKESGLTQYPPANTALVTKLVATKPHFLAHPHVAASASFQG